MRAPINPASPLSYRSAGGEKKRELPDKAAFLPKKGGIGGWKRTKVDESGRFLRTGPQVAVSVQPSMQALILLPQLRSAMVQSVAHRNPVLAQGNRPAGKQVTDHLILMWLSLESSSGWSSE
jgi:hypothetical protein